MNDFRQRHVFIVHYNGQLSGSQSLQALHFSGLPALQLAIDTLAFYSSTIDYISGWSKHGQIKILKPIVVRKLATGFQEK